MPSTKTPAPPDLAGAALYVDRGRGGSAQRLGALPPVELLPPELVEALAATAEPLAAAQAARRRVMALRADLTDTPGADCRRPSATPARSSKPAGGLAGGRRPAVAHRPGAPPAPTR